MLWGCLERSVRNYHYTLRSSLEEYVSYLVHRWSISFLFFCHNLLDHVPTFVFLRAHLMTLPTTQVIYCRIVAVNNEYQHVTDWLRLSKSICREGGMNLLYTGRKHCSLVDRDSYYIPRTLPKCIYIYIYIYIYMCGCVCVCVCETAWFKPHYGYSGLMSPHNFRQ